MTYTIVLLQYSDDDGNEIHRRDFRLRTLTSNNPIVWEEIEVEDLGDNTYQLEMPTRDEEGYRGFFIEVRKQTILLKFVSV